MSARSFVKLRCIECGWTIFVCGPDLVDIFDEICQTIVERHSPFSAVLAGPDTTTCPKCRGDIYIPPAEFFDQDRR